MTLDIQLLFNGIPENLKRYLRRSPAGSSNLANLPDIEPVGGGIKIRFLDKDGYEITNEEVYVGNDCAIEDTNLICRSSDSLPDANNYRKISKAIVSIQ